MKMKPMGDQILLKKQKNQEKTKSGIILTAGISNYETADVVAVGDGATLVWTGSNWIVTSLVGTAATAT